MTNDEAPREPLEQIDESEPARYTGFLIRRAQQVHEALWQTTVSRTVSSVQFGVLAVLARRPGVSQRLVGEEVDLDRSTIGDVVARLERRGLLTRERHQSDRRQNVLRLTAAGEAELVGLRPRVQQVERVLTDLLESSDRKELRRILSRLLESVDVRSD